MNRAPLTLLIVALGLSAPAAGGEGAPLRVHVPREARVQGRQLRLGDLCVIRGEDPNRVRAAEAVAMGRSPLPGEHMVIDRRTILSRLATVGPPDQAVRLTGSERVVVRRDERIISPRRLIRTARELLETRRPGPEGCTWRLVREPAALAVSFDGNVALRARLADGPPGGFVTVQVAAEGDGRRLGAAEVRLKCVYPVRQAVAVTDIARGETITRENVRVELTSSERRPTTAWTSPFGMVAAQAVKAGRVVPAAWIRAPRAEILVRRRQRVTMKIEGLGFVVTASGLALQDGRCGDYIKVRNIDTRRIVTARVGPDGTVQPLYKKKG
jgi:flagella basal body P-ring formation protein FlgA